MAGWYGQASRGGVVDYRLGTVPYFDESRPRKFHISLFDEQRIIHPTLIICSESRLARSLGSAVSIVGMPLWLTLSLARRKRLGRTDSRYRDRSALFWNTVGPRAFWAVATERVRRPAVPIIKDFGDLIDSPDAMHRYLGPGSRVIVVDDFYDDPEAVRAEALKAPLEVFDQGWLNTTRSGFSSTFAEEMRVKLEQAIGADLPHDAYISECDGLATGWNGAYHVKYVENWLGTNACDIHNHANLGESAWSGLVFLDHREGDRSGTSFWTSRKTGGGASKTWLYDARSTHFDLLTTVPSKFNRLVLFSAPLLHRGEAGYGWVKDSARLFQTTFFTVPESADSHS
jgi:hypothetical protein